MSVHHKTFISASAKSYQHKKQKEVQTWISLRDSLFSVLVQSHSPLGKKCGSCGCELKTIYRCRDCSYAEIFCLDCLGRMHKVLKLHCPEIWKVCNLHVEYFKERHTLNVEIQIHYVYILGLHLCAIRSPGNQTHQKWVSVQYYQGLSYSTYRYSW